MIRVTRMLMMPPIELKKSSRNGPTVTTMNSGWTESQKRRKAPAVGYTCDIYGLLTAQTKEEPLQAPPELQGQAPTARLQRRGRDSDHVLRR